jgi:hypothetical protein
MAAIAAAGSRQEILVMVAGKIFGWVDRRSADVPVGSDRRHLQAIGLARKKVRTRKVLDWLHLWRFWPIAATVILLPVLLWPASYWYDVKEIRVGSSTFGEPIPLVVDRQIKRPFYGEWSITIRQWDGGGWPVWCNAQGVSNYQAGAKLPKDLSLQWWTAGQCYPVPIGRYKVTTTWRIMSSPLLPTKVVSMESNIFEVRE